MSISIRKMTVFLAFCLVLSSGLSLTASDIFVSLDKNVATVSGGYAEFTLKSPATLSTDASKLNFDVRWNSTPTTSYKFYIWKNISHVEPVLTLVPKICSGLNGTYDCSYYEQTGTKIAYYFDWSPIGTESFTINQNYKFRVEATWKIPKPDSKGIIKVSRDWFPYINVAGTYYNMSAWAWWNASYKQANSSVSIYEPNETGSLLDISPFQKVGTITSVGASTVNVSKVSEQSKNGGYFKNDTTSVWNSSAVWSLSMWLQYNSSTSATEVLFGFGDSGLTQVALAKITGSTGLVECYIHGAGADQEVYSTMSPTIAVGDWFLLVYARNGSNSTSVCYIANNNVTTLSSDTGAPTSNPFVMAVIGANYDYNAPAIHYLINQVVFWNDTLSPDDVAWLYNNGQGQNYSGVKTTSTPSTDIVTSIFPNDLAVNITNNIYFGYLPNFSTSPIRNCSLYLNGTLTNTNSTIVTNNTLNSIYYDFPNDGTYAWKIGCLNSSGTVYSAERTLTVINYLSNATASANELTRQMFNLTFTSNNYTFSNVGLIYNSLYYPATDLGAKVWNVSLIVPVVMANNTNLTYYWNYTRTNATVSEVKTTSTASQSVYLSYIPFGSVASAVGVLEGSLLTLYMSVENLSAIGTSTVIIDIDGVNRTATYLGENNSLLNYSYTFNVGTITPISQSKNWTWYSKISYLGLSRNVTLTTVNVTIYKVTVTDCSSGLPTFVYKTYDEENGTYLNDSNYNLRVVTRSGNITTTYSSAIVGQRNITVCLFPNWANATADLSLIYSGQTNATFPQRTYYNFGVVLTNVTQIQNVFLINTSRAYLVNIDTRDQYGSVAPNIVVYFERFNYTSNQFFNVTNVFTTEGGTGLTYLVRYDVPYRIVLRDTIGNILSTYDNYFISASPITLRTVSEVIDVYQRFLDVSHSCSYDGTAKVLTCSYNDPNSILTMVEFKVTEVFNYISTVVCAENKTAYSGEFTCDLSATDNASKGYYYEMNAYDPTDVEYVYALERGNINRPSSSIFGANGVIFALFFFISMFLLGIWKPVIAVMLGIASIFFSYLFGWLNLGTAPIFIFGTLIVLGLFIVWKLKER